MRWLERYLLETSPRLQRFAEITRSVRVCYDAWCDLHLTTTLTSRRVKTKSHRSSLGVASVRPGESKLRCRARVGLCELGIRESSLDKPTGAPTGISPKVTTSLPSVPPAPCSSLRRRRSRRLYAPR